MGVGVWHAEYLKMTARTHEVHQETKSVFLFLVVIYAKSQIVLLECVFCVVYQHSQQDLVCVLPKCCGGPVWSGLHQWRPCMCL